MRISTHFVKNSIFLVIEWEIVRESGRGDMGERFIKVVIWMNGRDRASGNFLLWEYKCCFHVFLSNKYVCKALSIEVIVMASY